MCLGSCCCSHYCLEVQQTPPHPPRRQCSCVDNLAACLPTFRNNHTGPRTSGCSRVHLCAFPYLLSFPFFPLTCLPCLPLSAYTASISIDASPIAGLTAMTVSPLMMAWSGREPQVSNRCGRSCGGTLSAGRTAFLTFTPSTSPLSYYSTSNSNTRHQLALAPNRNA